MKKYRQENIANENFFQIKKNKLSNQNDLITEEDDMLQI